jgi:DNA-binding MarR family transcriptional regulator
MTIALATVNGRSQVRPETDAARLRRLIVCRDQAAERHRTIAGRLLGLDRTEAAAMALFTTSPVLSVGAVSDRLALSAGGTSLLVKRLERQGAIERRAHPHDYRRVLLAATRSHVEAAAALYAPLTARLDELIRQLPAATRTKTMVWLPQVIAVLDEHADALLAERRRRERVVGAPAAPGPWA